MAKSSKRKLVVQKQIKRLITLVTGFEVSNLALDLGISYLPADDYKSQEKPGFNCKLT